MKSPRITPFFVLAILAGAGASQNKGTATPPGAETAQTPAKKFEALVARYNKEREDAYQAYVKATTEEEKQKIIAGMPGKNYVPEFRARGGVRARTPPPRPGCGSRG
jgi:hypothetical protein